MERRNFYKGQNVKADNLNELQDYTDGSQGELITSLLGYGVVSGFDVSIISGFLVRVGSGLAFSVEGNRLYLESATQVNLSAYTPNADTTKVKIGIVVDYTKSDPAIDSMGDTVYTKWTPTVQIVTGATLETGVFEIAEVTLSPVGVDSINTTAVVFDNLPSVEAKLQKEIDSTNERTSALVTVGDTAELTSPNLIINGYPYLKTDLSIVSRVPRYLQVPDAELGAIKSNIIEILCDNIIIGTKAYKPPVSFVNEFVGNSVNVGTDVLVIAYVKDDELCIKQVDWTDDDYTVADNEVLLGGYHIGANRTYVDKGICDEGATLYLGIVEDSFWTPYFRPESDPRGMVYIDNGTWWDIYLNSMEWIDDKPKLVSKYDKVIATGQINSIQWNNLCTYGLCWLDFAELFGNIKKTFPTDTEYFRMCASQPLLRGVATQLESNVKNSARYYVNESAICSSLNNYGLTDLFNLIGFWGGKSDYFNTSYGWQQTSIGHFLSGETAHSIITYYDSYRHHMFGYNHLGVDASSAFYPHSNVSNRFWYRGGRGSSITQQH